MCPFGTNLGDPLCSAPPRTPPYPLSPPSEVSEGGGQYPFAVPKKIYAELPFLCLIFLTAALSSPCFILPRREPPLLTRSQRGTPLEAQGSSTPKPPVPSHRSKILRGVDYKRVGRLTGPAPLLLYTLNVHKKQVEINTVPMYNNLNVYLGEVRYAYGITAPHA